MEEKEIIKKLRDALVGLVGCSSRSELEQQKIAVRTMNYIDAASRVAMLNAIDVLIDIEKYNNSVVF